MQLKNNERKLYFIIKKLYNKIIKNKFIIDKSGVKTVELISTIIKLKPKQSILNFNNIKKTNEEYCKKELNWYLSQSLSIIDYVDTIKIWNDICTKDKKKEVNSNYGWCIFSEENDNQYDFCLNELLKNNYSRRACMIYNRPSITTEYNRNGMSDYLCTNYIQCFIRDNKLIYEVHQRSCDIIFGFFNDFYWHCYIYNKILLDLKDKIYNLKVGSIHYIIGSFHCYEKHFSIIKEIYLSYKDDK
jgi:thymidylate synthase